ncbi:hypothetical protein [Sorangium sp. So ce204]|uniref:hypothetical protein n=1 Tax=Sorangium sp. So ce204 TaxID=3133288 RepID=UPI003F63C115
MTSSPHFIDAFLDRWTEASGSNGIDLRVRVHEALSLGGPWTRHRLRLTLRPILALDEQRRALFDQEFDRFFPGPGLPPWFLERLEGTRSDVAWSAERARREVAEHVERIVEAPARSEEEGPATLPLARGPAAMSLPAGVPISPRAERADESAAPAPGASTALFARAFGARNRRFLLAAAFAAVLVALAIACGVAIRTWRTGPAEAGAGGSAVEPAVAPRDIVPPSAPTRRGVPPPIAITVLGLSLVVGGLGFRQLRAARARAKAPQPEPVAPDFDPRRDSGARLVTDPTPFNEREMRRAAQRAGLLPNPAEPVLDLAATVHATARQCGVLDPVYVPGRAPSLLSLIVASPLDIVAAAFVADLKKKLDDTGIEVAEMDGRQLPSTDRTLLLVLVDASLRPTWLSPAWVQAYGPHVALIETRDPGLWGPELRRLPCAPFPPTARGVMDAIEAAHDGRSTPPLSLPVAARGLAALREAFPLAAALALVEPCSLEDLDDLRKAQFPDIAFSAIQRILALDGVIDDASSIHLPAWLREKLTARVSLTARRKTLEWKRSRLDQTKPDEATRARAIWERERALVEIQLAALPKTTGAKAPPASGSDELRDEQLGRLREAIATLEGHAADAHLGRRARERCRGVAPLVKELYKTVPRPEQRRLAQLGMLVGLPEPGIGEMLASAWTKVASAAAAGSLSVASLGYSAWEGFRPRLCEDGLTKCGELCFETSRDPQNCGVCGNACPEGWTCEGGVCHRPWPPIECVPPWKVCSDECVDLLNDPRHCGDCENFCAIGEVCRNGNCECNNTKCGDRCVDTQQDPDHCGDCTNRCEGRSVCQNGRCVPGEWCGDRLVNTHTDPLNCGGCGVSCLVDTIEEGLYTGKCTNSKCVTCTQGYRNCDHTDICETDIENDTENCGGCGKQCPDLPAAWHATPTCVSGKCDGFICTREASGRLLSGLYADCNQNASDGCEINLLTNPQHCGKCGNECSARDNATASCAQGRCAWICHNGFSDCNGDGSCETRTTSDVSNCGGCGQACRVPANGRALCGGGVCTFECNEGFTRCGDQCVDVTRDPAHCSACGNACPTAKDATPGCVDSGCTLICQRGLQLCGGACKDVQRDSAHCGACGTACPSRTNATPSCSAGNCGIICNPGYSNCDGDAVNGCETTGACEQILSCEDRCAALRIFCREECAKSSDCWDACEQERLKCMMGCEGAPTVPRPTPRK